MDAVLNWLWQGGVVAVASVVMLFALERARANVRYVVCWAAVAAGRSPCPRCHRFHRQRRRCPTRSCATQTDAVVSLPDAWWTSTLVILAAWTLWAGIQTRQVRLGDRRDPSRARAQPRVPAACSNRACRTGAASVARGGAPRSCCPTR